MLLQSICCGFWFGPFRMTWLRALFRNYNLSKFYFFSRDCIWFYTLFSLCIVFNIVPYSRYTQRIISHNNSNQGPLDSKTFNQIIQSSSVDGVCSVVMELICWHANSVAAMILSVAHLRLIHVGLKVSIMERTPSSDVIQFKGQNNAMRNLSCDCSVKLLFLRSRIHFDSNLK